MLSYMCVGPPPIYRFWVPQVATPLGSRPPEEHLFFEIEHIDPRKQGWKLEHSLGRQVFGQKFFVNRCVKTPPPSHVVAANGGNVKACCGVKDLLLLTSSLRAVDTLSQPYAFWYAGNLLLARRHLPRWY